MKNLKTIFYLLFVAIAMAACSYKDIQPDNGGKLTGDDGDGVFLTIDIEMPTGNASRSETITGGGSSSGIEVGSDLENTVTNALVVLAERNTHAFIAAGEVATNRLTSMTVAGTPAYKAVAKISKTNLNQFYENVTPGVEPVVEVFVFCNPTKGLLTDISRMPYGNTDWVNLTAEVSQGNPEKPDFNIGIWSPNSFLMSNSQLTTRALPKDLLDW